MSKRDKKNPDAAGQPHPLSGIVFLAMGALLLWGTRSFVDYGNLWSKLSGKSFLERGSIGSNENQNFLARAGRLNFQENYRKTRQLIEETLDKARMRGQSELQGGIRSADDIDKLPSGVANGWVWVMRAGKMLDADAKIYLNFNSQLHYFYGNVFWYPRRVEVARKTVGIRDADTLKNNSQPVKESDSDELRRLGFTHVLNADEHGERLDDIRAARGGEKP